MISIDVANVTHFVNPKIDELKKSKKKKRERNKLASAINQGQLHKHKSPYSVLALHIFPSNKIITADIRNEQRKKTWNKRLQIMFEWDQQYRQIS